MQIHFKLVNSKVVMMNIIFFTVFVVIATFRFFYLNGDAGDSALFENIALQSSFPNYANEFLISIQVLIRKFVSDPNSVSIFNFPNDFGLNGNLMGAHAYLSFPAISFFTKIFGFRIFISLVAAAISILPLVIAANLITRYTDKKRIKKYLPVLFILICYPAIIWSGMGQFYPDRLFIITFPIFLLILDRASNNPSRKSVQTLFWLFLLNSATTERASLYVALACGIYCIRGKYHKKTFLILATTAFFWSILYYKNISTDVYTNSYFDTAKSLSGLQSLLLSTPTLKLLLLHIPGFILVYRMWDLRLMLLIGLIPNLFGNIGGAEKIGWVTHYMTYIAAVYIAVVLVWLQREILKVELSRKSIGKKTETLEKGPSLDLQKLSAVTTAIALFIVINPNSRNEIVEINPIKHSGVFGATYNWLAQGQSRLDYRAYREEVQLIIKTISTQSNIGVSEETSKYVSKNFRNIHMFPVNLDSLDYVVLKSAGGTGEAYIQTPIVNYANPEVGVSITEQAQKLLVGRCFIDITPNNSSKIHIFKRNQDFDLDEKCLSSD
jgi:hypothetical protein